MKWFNEKQIPVIFFTVTAGFVVLMLIFTLLSVYSGVNIKIPSLY